MLDAERNRASLARTDHAERVNAQPIPDMRLCLPLEPVHKDAPQVAAVEKRLRLELAGCVRSHTSTQACCMVSVRPEATVALIAPPMRVPAPGISIMTLVTIALPAPVPAAVMPGPFLWPG